jgi:putative PEP-CTERM system TPR-repeat lipoprotein
MKKQLASAVLAAGLVLVSACAKEFTSEEHLARAGEFMAEGDYASAQIELKNAALKDPQSAAARYELAHLALLQGDWAAAEKEARRAIELGVAGEVYLHLARALYMQESYQALLEFTDDLSEMPGGAVRADILGYRALAQVRLRQYRDAEATIQAALELADSVTALLARSAYEQQVGSRETALELAEQAVAQDPAFALGWMQVGEMKQLQGDLKGARAAYDRAVEAQSYVSLASARRAFIAARVGDTAQAEADIGAFEGTMYREHPEVTFAAGYLAYLQGRYDDAAMLFTQSLAGGEVQPVAALYLASSFVQTGKMEQARQVVNQLYRAIPNSIELNRLMATIEIEQQNFDAARERIAALPDAGESDEVALGMLGTMAMVEGDTDAAVAYFEKLVALSPDDEDARNMLQRAMTMRGDLIGEMSGMADGGISEDDYGKALLSAASAYKQGRVEESLAIAHGLQQQFPDKVDPLNLLAAIYIASGELDKGRDYFSKALALDPENPSATRSMAKIYLANGEEERALRMMEEYVKNHPADRAATGILANAIAVTLDYPEAERRLTQLLQGVNDNVQARAYLARLHFDNGKFEQVLYVTENLSPEAIQAQPTLIELRGKSLVNLGRLAEAGGTWERWLNVFPESVLANYYQGLYLDSVGKGDEAMEYLEKSRSLNPNYLPVRLRLIREYAVRGDRDRALRELRQLQSELSSERAEVWLADGWLQVQLGDYAAAASALEKSLALEPTPDAVILQFVTLNTLGRPDEALETLEAWLKTFPQNETMLSMLARTYLEKGDNGRAISLYKRMLAVNPDSVEALNNLAWAMQDADLEQAVTYAKLALEIAPDDPRLLDTVKVLRGKGGRF